MIRSLFLLLFLLALLHVRAQLIPQPVEVNYPAEVNGMREQYKFADKWYYEMTGSKTANDKLFLYLQNEMKKSYGFTLLKAVPGKKANIRIKFSNTTTDKPVYKLNVSKDGITIEGNNEEAVFYGLQTFIQLLTTTASTKKMDFVSIIDFPRFQYRGMHLDVGRHFFPVSFIKKYIDYLAYHKFNKFHWHLTEDQGWRIEIKKYPLLTSVGAWRNGTIVGRFPGKGNDNTDYGGFYTQAEIRDVVKYAKDRFIEVIPEIEMPGHSGAAIAAYPYLSCFPDNPTFIPPNMISAKSVMEQKQGRKKLVQETWGVFDDVFCAGNDSTFLFLQNVIDEVVTLFPSKYFHIGGDECPKTHWKKCPRCQQRMKDLGLKDEHELQSYFVQRIEKYLNKKGKTLIGWDEILEGGLAPNAIVMSWRGEKGGIEAAKLNHQVIMSPGNPVYFDYTQSEREDSVTIGGYNPIDKVYAYEPIPGELNAEQAKFVLGAQANVWTEYMEYPSKVEYMIFPRMSALSEVLWSPARKRDWNDFLTRLKTQFKRYRTWKSNYSLAIYEPTTTVTTTENNDGLIWKVANRFDKSYTRFSKEMMDPYDTNVGNDVNKQDANTNVANIVIREPGHYMAEIFSLDKLDSGLSPASGNAIVVRQAFYINKATGKKITLKEEAAKKYPGDGAFTLINGVQNEKGMARTKEFLGFEGSDCIASIDFGAETEFSEIIIHHFEQKPSWIYSPSAVDVGGSNDGITFSPFNSNFTISKSPDKDRTTLKFSSPVKTRFLKVSILNHGTIASGNPGEGNRAWLFVDEIEVK